MAKIDEDEKRIRTALSGAVGTMIVHKASDREIYYPVLVCGFTVRRQPETMIQGRRLPAELSVTVHAMTFEAGAAPRPADFALDELPELGISLDSATPVKA